MLSSAISSHYSADYVCQKLGEACFCSSVFGERFHFHMDTDNWLTSSWHNCHKTIATHEGQHHLSVSIKCDKSKFKNFSSTVKHWAIKYYLWSFKNTLQRLFERGPISRVLKTTTRGAFSERRHGSQRRVCQITNACSITLTCQKMVVNIAVGRQGWLGNSPKLSGQISCWPSQSLVVSPHPSHPTLLSFASLQHALRQKTKAHTPYYMQ